MRSLLWYLFAALGEIAGCFAFWAWLRLGKSSLDRRRRCLACSLPMALTRIDAPAAGRAYAAYGGIYMLSSLR